MTEVIGTARLDIVVNTEDLEPAIERAKRSVTGMSQAAQAEYTRLNAAERRRADALIRQADTLGLTRAQQVAYNATLTTGSAAEAIAAVASTGRFTGEQLTLVATAAEQMRAATGKAIEETIAEFEELRKDPVRAILELNDKYHFLTRAQLERIETLKKEGREQEAVTEAMRTYAGVIDDRAPQVVQHLGSIERAWRDIKLAGAEAIDGLLSIGRFDLSTEAGRAMHDATEARKHLQSLQARMAREAGTGVSQAAVAEDRRREAELKKMIADADAVVARTRPRAPAAAATVDSAAERARQEAEKEFDRLALTNLDKKAKLEAEKDLLRRDGITEDRVDVEDLWFEIDGYKVAIEGGANVMVEPLQAAYFFDPGEWDGRMHFILRGRHAPVASLGPDDLVQREGPAIEFERVQEAEILRKVNVISVDPEAGYTPTSQSAERRSSLIRARGEATVEVPLTLPRDVAAQVADKRLKLAWSELQKIRHAVTVKWAHLTATDTVELTDRKGATYRIRLMDLQEDTGVIAVESSDDAPWAYDSNATGVIYRAPASTTPGLVGQTLLEVVNIPVTRDQDDEPGVLLAARGTKSGWHGAEIQISTDGGATSSPAAQIDVPATIGYTASALAAEISSEYLSPQALRVSLPDPPSSVDYETLLRYFNRAAVKRADGTWEVLQYQTVTAVDATTFDLSGLVRGRYATAPLAIPSGAVFVLIDDALVFAQAQQWMIGQPMQFRGVSYGESADGVAWLTPNLATIASQTEWPVHSVSAARDGANAVTVRWVGRARLGAETAPHHSKYFRGWRVAFSDGFSADTIDQQYTRASTPVGATVTVAPINHLTGLGPASESIPT